MLENIELPTTLFPEEAIPGLYAVAHEFYRNGKYEEGRIFFHFLTVANPFDSRFWMGLAACYQMLKNHQAASSAYAAAAVQNSADPYAHFHAAECFFHMGDIPKALKALDSSLTVAKESEEYLHLIPRLELLLNTWSNTLQTHGGCHD
ncbi:MAG: SycD/LcrH family type III secretion system chaperone [Parachlamydiaceae bacterium]